MIKVIAGFSILLLVAGGAWGWGTRGAQKLDQLDRLFGSRAAKRVAHDIAYGPHRRQKLDIYAPVDGGGSAPRPLLVFIYGGSWNSGDKADYAFAAKAYAEQGFIVVLPDYRLVPEVRYPEFVEDAALAVAEAVEIGARYGANPEQLVLAGHSAGGHSALMLALDPQWLNKVGIGKDAVKGVAAISAPTDFLPMTNPAAIAALGHIEPAELTQPIHFVRADAPPIWLGTGGDDETVKPRNSKVLAEAINDMGGKASYKEYAGLDHVDPLMALSRPFERKGAVLADSAQFLKEAIKP